MSVVETQTNLSTNELVKAVKQMSLKELDRFVPQIIALLAERKAPYASAAESKLLMKINKGLPPKLKKKLDRLVAKRKAGTLKTDEQKELISLMHEVEEAQVRRIEALTGLAKLRGVSLDSLMDQLGIKAPEYT
ncbi:MAG: STAS/SEC14 domain-containing protein [bacterium]